MPQIPPPGQRRPAVPAKPRSAAGAAAFRTSVLSGRGISQTRKDLACIRPPQVGGTWAHAAQCKDPAPCPAHPRPPSLRVTGAPSTSARIPPRGKSHPTRGEPPLGSPPSGPTQGGDGLGALGCALGNVGSLLLEADITARGPRRLGRDARGGGQARDCGQGASPVHLRFPKWRLESPARLRTKHVKKSLLRALEQRQSPCSLPPPPSCLPTLFFKKCCIIFFKQGTHSPSSKFKWSKSPFCKPQFVLLLLKRGYT